MTNKERRGYPWINRFWLTLVCLGFLSPLGVTTARGEIRLATQVEENTVSEEGILLVVCAMDMIGEPYTITRVPWARAQRDTERGVFDGFFQASRNAQRDAYAVYSEPFVWIKWLYVTRKGAGISPEDPDFGTRIFSANLGSARLRWLQVKQESGEISELTPAETPYVAIKMMLTDRVDVVLTNNFDLKGVFEEQSVDPYRVEIFTAREVPTAVYFGKEFVANNPGFLDRFNQSIKECKE